MTQINDTTVTYENKPSDCIKSAVSSPRGFGTMMKTISANEYLGKRIRMSAYVKTENVGNWTGLWMRVDGPENKVLSFDNMGNRKIKGTVDWTKYEIVLNVPQNSTNISFGVLLEGIGQVWINSLQFEEVDSSVSITGR
ncbi:MAG: hypothetical protein AABY84_09340 [Candidatus Firestonebacteria bacterium]